VFLGESDFLKIVLQQFRSSGRFFWPVGYMLMAAGLALALKVRRPLNFAFVLAAAVLQFIDAGPLRDGVAERVRSGRQFNIPAEPWRALIAAHERLTVVPSFDCAASFNRHVLDLIFHASSSATPVNTAYLARRRAVDCDQEIASLYSRKLAEGELLVVLSPPLEKVRVSQMPGFENLCRSFTEGFACSRERLVLEDRLAPGFSDSIAYDPRR
jgi:hypothetical protein